MKRICDDSGITLISLVVTIIVLLILTSIATYNGIDVIRDSQFTKFSEQLKIMQVEVNDLYDKYKNNQSIEIQGTTYTGKEIEKIGKDLSDLPQATKVFSTNNSGITDATGYMYYDEETLKNLGIENVDEDGYFVNVAKRSVVSYSGMYYRGKEYYTMDQIPNGLYNVEYEKTDS